jgi:FlaA1/EpsC-like NDP-sugar epimerase
MVTGAGGSIGAELCRHIARFRPAKLVLFDLSEAALYGIQTTLADSFPQLPMATIVGDVKHAALVEEVLSRERPSVIFHAGAYKHVPLMEETNAWQAVLNNTYGTWVVGSAAVAAKVEKFVLVSSDKAVNPTNVMGATKRLAEIACCSLQGRGTQFVIVRFGNVFGSAGSVIPRFREQIGRGGPVTVTHPDITRYFMSLSEATQLLLQAALQGRDGEILVLDMGDPVRIIDLAHDMIRLSGADPDRIPIVFTGLRPGEKLFEELLTCGGSHASDAPSEAADRAFARREFRRRGPDGRVVPARSSGRRRRSARAPQGVDSGIRAARRRTGATHPDGAGRPDRLRAAARSARRAGASAKRGLAQPDPVSACRRRDTDSSWRRCTS